MFQDKTHFQIHYFFEDSEEHTASMEAGSCELPVTGEAPLRPPQGPFTGCQRLLGWVACESHWGRAEAG